MPWPPDPNPHSAPEKTRARRTPTSCWFWNCRRFTAPKNRLARELPRLSEAAQSQTLREMLDERLEEGERIIGDIESVFDEFDELDESPGRKRNVAAEGLINDAREHVQEIERGPALMPY